MLSPVRTSRMSVHITVVYNFDYTPQVWYGIVEFNVPLDTV